MARHVIADARAEAVAGVGALVLAAVLLRDAYERRGHRQPLWLKPFAWW